MTTEGGNGMLDIFDCICAYSFRVGFDSAVVARAKAVDEVHAAPLAPACSAYFR